MIVVGKNANDNWRILDNASPNDTLFHLTHYPSCYVILSDGDTRIEEAARLCKTNTKYKNVPYVSVDYTSCSNVCKGDIVGEIHYISRRKVLKIII